MNEVSTRWLGDVAEHIDVNPHLILNGFLRSGIRGTFDRNIDNVEEEDDSRNKSSQVT